MASLSTGHPYKSDASAWLGAVLCLSLILDHTNKILQVPRSANFKKCEFPWSSCLWHGPASVVSAEAGSPMLEITCSSPSMSSILAASNALVFRVYPILNCIYLFVRGRWTSLLSNLLSKHSRLQWQQRLRLKVCQLKNNPDKTTWYK